MSHYLKKSLFTLMILILPYMNLPSKAMKEDIPPVAFKAKLYDAVSTFANSVKEDESLTSLVSTASFVLAPAKRLFWNTSETALDFGIRNPAVTGGLSILYLTSAASAKLWCMLVCLDGKTLDGRNIYYGCDVNDCGRICTINNQQAVSMCDGRLSAAGCQRDEFPCD